MYKENFVFGIVVFFIHKTIPKVFGPNSGDYFKFVLLY